MKKEKIVSFLILGIFLIGIASAANYCCEKTKSGAWCQTVSSSSECNSDPPFQMTPSFCQSTSYCKAGTCINQNEGTCTESAQAVCNGPGAFWSDQPAENLPQCRVGCCLIGDDAELVTVVKCNQDAKKYNLNINFKANINDEQTCLANANPTAKGACVYTDTQNYTRDCLLETKSDCQANAKNSAYLNVSFHEGFLCSAPELGTICVPSKQTKCGADGKVYFVDTCGQLANIYDSAKIDDLTYWTKIQKNFTGICGTNNNNAGNKNSATCGDCDYYAGSMCDTKKVGDNLAGGTLIGNNFCRNLDCINYRGPYSGSSTGFATSTNYPKHGESWC